MCGEVCVHVVVAAGAGSPKRLRTLHFADDVDDDGRSSEGDDSSLQGLSGNKGVGQLGSSGHPALRRSATPFDPPSAPLHLDVAFPLPDPSDTHSFDHLLVSQPRGVHDWGFDECDLGSMGDHGMGAATGQYEANYPVCVRGLVQDSLPLIDPAFPGSAEGVGCGMAVRGGTPGPALPCGPLGECFLCGDPDAGQVCSVVLCCACMCVCCALICSVPLLHMWYSCLL